MRHFILLILFAVCMYQVELAQEITPLRVVTINSSKFDDKKTGIKRYVNAFSALESETSDMGMGMNRVKLRYEELEKKIQTDNSITNCDDFKKWVKEDSELRPKIAESDINFQKQFIERQEIVLGPVYKQIEAALKDYTKSKKIDLIIDVGKDEYIITVKPEGMIDVTADFIAYFNSRYP